MAENKRRHFRVKVPPEVDFFVTLGRMGQVKHNLEDISESGICFTSHSPLPTGEDAIVSLHFPNDTNALELTIKPTRCEEVEQEKPVEEASEEEEVEEDFDEVPIKKSYQIAGRFMALTMGQEDRIYGEIRKLERLGISIR